MIVWCTYQEVTLGKLHKYNQRKNVSLKALVKSCRLDFRRMMWTPKDLLSLGSEWCGRQEDHRHTLFPPVTLNSLEKPQAKKLGLLPWIQFKRKTKAPLCSLLSKEESCGHRICYWKPAWKKSIFETRLWVIGDSSFCGARTCKGQSWLVNKYLHSLNCAVISSLMKTLKLALW